MSLTCQCCGKELGGAVLERLLQKMLAGERVTIPAFCPDCASDEHTMRTYRQLLARRALGLDKENILEVKR